MSGYNFKKLIMSVKAQWHYIIVIMLSSGLSALMSVLTAVCTKVVIDAAVKGDVKKAILYLAFILGIILLIIALKIISQAQMERAFAKIEMAFRKLVMESIERAKFSKIDVYSDGEIMNRIFSDVSIVASNILSIFPVVFEIIVRFIGIIVVLWFIDYRLCILSVVGTLIAVGLTAFFRRGLKKLHKVMQEKAGNLWHYVGEILSNLVIVKTFSIYKYVNEETERYQNEHFDARMKKRNLNIVVNTSLFAAFEFAYLFVIAFGAYGISANVMTYGSFVAILQLLPQVKAPINNMASLVPAYYATIASFERVMEIVDIEKEEVSDVDIESLYDEIEKFSFENVYFGYKDLTVVRGLSAEIKKGKITLIKGRSGIGKSTMTKLLLGLYDVDGGEIFAVKKSGEKLPVSSEIRGLFSYVPQNFMLFSGSIRDNFMAVRDDLTDEMIRSACEVSNANVFIDELPDGIDSLIGVDGNNLSEGQLQRVAIARAVLSKAPVIILDEATSALDEANEQTVLKNIKNLDNKTVIMISHKPNADKVCDEVIELVPADV